MDVIERLAILERRLQAVEDELAIHKLIVRYGFAVDLGDDAAAAAVFAPDAVYDVDVGRMDGRAAVAAMVRGPTHQSMVGRCAHQIGPVVIDVHDGRRAVATGYSRVYLRTDSCIGIHRVSSNRWELAKNAGGWLIHHRTTRLLGHAEARSVLAGLLRGDG